MILTQLLSDARSQKDKAALQSCILTDCLGREGGREGEEGGREGGEGGGRQEQKCKSERLIP